MSRIHILKGFSGIDGALWVLKFHPGLPSRQDMAHTVAQNGYTVTNKRVSIKCLFNSNPTILMLRVSPQLRFWKRNCGKQRKSDVKGNKAKS